MAYIITAVGILGMILTISLAMPTETDMNMCQQHHSYDICYSIINN